MRLGSLLRTCPPDDRGMSPEVLKGVVTLHTIAGDPFKRIDLWGLQSNTIQITTFANALLYSHLFIGESLQGVPTSNTHQIEQIDPQKSQKHLPQLSLLIVEWVRGQTNNGIAEFSGYIPLGVVRKEMSQRKQCLASLQGQIPILFLKKSGVGGQNSTPTKMRTFSFRCRCVGRKQKMCPCLKPNLVSKTLHFVLLRTF